MTFQQCRYFLAFLVLALIAACDEPQHPRAPSSGISQAARPQQQEAPREQAPKLAETEEPSAAEPEPAKSPIAQRIDALVHAQAARPGDKTVSAAVVAFYEARQFEPIWDDGRVERLNEALQELRFDGLDPADYDGAGPVEAQLVKVANDDDVDGQTAQRDVRTTQAYLLALTHLRRGKIAAARRPPEKATLSPHQKPPVMDEAQLDMQAAVDAAKDSEFAEAFARARPQNPIYDSMRGALKALLEQQQAGDKSKQLRAHIDQLRVNLERARWQLQGLGGDFVLVDIAGYEVRQYAGGKPVWSSRAQVGEVQTPTPMQRSAITRISLNPQWIVPPGMMIREYIARIEDNPGYLKRMRLQVIDAAGNEVDPDDVDWDEPEEAIGYMLRQEPGPGGALGRAAIRFPSPYGVYLHETPHKKLFDRPQRNFSNGCIRVEKAMELVQRLLGWSQEQIDSTLADGKTHEVDLQQPVPVLLAYLTVGVGEDGAIAYRPDVYGLDAPTLKALNG